MQWAYGFIDVRDWGVGDWDFDLLWPNASDSLTCCILGRLGCRTIHSPSSSSYSCTTGGWSVLALASEEGEQTAREFKHQDRVIFPTLRNTETFTSRTQITVNTKQSFDSFLQRGVCFQGLRALRPGESHFLKRKSKTNLLSWHDTGMHTLKRRMIDTLN